MVNTDHSLVNSCAKKYHIGVVAYSIKNLKEQ